MTFQNTFPDIDFLPEGEDKEKSFLYQISHQKTPSKVQVVQQVQEVKRSLFQERGNVFNDDEIEIEEQEPIKVPAKPQGESALKGYTVYKEYNVMLNLTDISYGVKGHNKFYQIQILVKNDEFYLFTKWGRTGAPNPASDLKPVDSRVEGITMFKKKFSDKTHQEWDCRDEFKQQAGKYQMVSVVGGGGGSINEEIEKLNQRNALIAAKSKSIPSKLEQPILELMRQIWDISRMNKTLKELNFDTQKNPLGRLTNEAITKGFKILNEVQQVLRGNYKGDQLIELSNQFYTNIPQNYGMRKPPVIDNYEILAQKNHLLSLLQEMEVANKYINLSISEQSGDNPLDCFYRFLKADIKVCKDQDVCTILSDSVRQTHGPTHDKFKLQITEIYEVQRRLEHIRYYPFKGFENRKLLWHGSRLSNFVGILSEGLKIAPPDAPSTGYMFGKGIYFADVCSKSASYCHHSKENADGYVLLCEVALGNQYQVFKAKDFQKPPQHHHSVHGVGRNQCDPKKRVLLKDIPIECGEVIANDELKQNNIESALIYNEYVVYDVAQVNIKYLVKLSFIC